MVLIIDRSLRAGESVADMFRYMGVLSRAVKPQNAVTEISPRYRAVLLPNPRAIIDLPDFISRFRHSCAGIPIFALLHDGEDSPLATLFDRTFPEETTSSLVLMGMREYCRGTHRYLPGDYYLYGIDASAVRRGVFFFDRPLSLTRTETMLLRFLIRAYPLGVSAEEILRVLFRSSARPEVSDVRTHVFGINKKFRLAEGRPLIFMTRGVGYRILTSENDPAFSSHS